MNEAKKITQEKSPKQKTLDKILGGDFKAIDIFKTPELDEFRDPLKRFQEQIVELDEEEYFDSLTNDNSF